MTLFVLLWGVIDLAGTVFSLVGLKNLPPTAAYTAEGPSLILDKAESRAEGKMLYDDTIYQTNLLYERLWDSLARVLFAGAIFIYCRKTAEKLEAQA